MRWLLIAAMIVLMGCEGELLEPQSYSHSFSSKKVAQSTLNIMDRECDFPDRALIDGEFEFVKYRMSNPESGIYISQLPDDEYRIEVPLDLSSYKCLWSNWAWREGSKESELLVLGGIEKTSGRFDNIKWKEIDFDYSKIQFTHQVTIRFDDKEEWGTCKEAYERGAPEPDACNYAGYEQKEKAKIGEKSD